MLSDCVMSHEEEVFTGLGLSSCSSWIACILLSELYSLLFVMASSLLCNDGRPSSASSKVFHFDKRLADIDFEGTGLASFWPFDDSSDTTSPKRCIRSDCCCRVLSASSSSLVMDVSSDTVVAAVEGMHTSNCKLLPSISTLCMDLTDSFLTGCNIRSSLAKVDSELCNAVTYLPLTGGVAIKEPAVEVAAVVKVANELFPFILVAVKPPPLYFRGDMALLCSVDCIVAIDDPNASSMLRLIDAESLLLLLPPGLGPSYTSLILKLAGLGGFPLSLLGEDGIVVAFYHEKGRRSL